MADRNLTNKKEAERSEQVTASPFGQARFHIFDHDGAVVPCFSKGHLSALGWQREGCGYPCIGVFRCELRVRWLIICIPSLHRRAGLTSRA